MTFIFNPGTGPVENHSEDQAVQNMQKFVRALGCGNWSRKPELDHDGRYGFEVKHNESACIVLMPGCSISSLLNDPFPPRLYVDGSSWFWPFAITVARDKLQGC